MGLVFNWNPAGHGTQDPPDSLVGAAELKTQKSCNKKRPADVKSREKSERKVCLRAF